MAKHDKNIVKSGFVIKLSTETLQKLTEEDETNKAAKSDVIVTSPNKEKIVEVPKKLENLNTVSQDNALPDILENDNETATKTQSSVTLKDTNEKDQTFSELSGSQHDNDSWGDYAPYITYDNDVAIYTDPNTGQKYTWSNTSNSWVQKSIDNQQQDVPGRVYSYENDTHIYTDSDGSKFFWDVDKKAWIPKVDDDFLAYYQMSYGFVDNAIKDKKSDEVNKTVESAKKTELLGPKRKADPQWFDASDENNTKVYVSNLPLDITEEEFVDLMQKYGLVMRDHSTQKMKVKLYVDKEHNCFKGDALCTYIKIESVELALKLLDGFEYKGHKIKVEKAHFQLKGDYNPALKPKKKKKKELEKIKRMQEKLFDWRPEKIIGEKAKHEKVVIIKNLFQPSDFDKEVQLILDYQQDLREELSKCGEVRKVVIYDRHPEGVAQVTMKEPEQADAVVLLINGRWFGKRKLTAEIWDGRTKYKIAETDAEINKRLDNWGKFLEGKEGDKEDKESDEKKVLQPVKGVCSANVEKSVDDNKHKIAETDAEINKRLDNSEKFLEEKEGDKESHQKKVLQPVEGVCSENVEKPVDDNEKIAMMSTTSGDKETDPDQEK